MKYCSNCGSKLNEKQHVCLDCGILVTNNQNTTSYDEDSSSVIYTILGIIVPFLGLILYLLWANRRPKSAKAAGLGWLIHILIMIGSMIIFRRMGFFHGRFFPHHCRF